MKGLHDGNRGFAVVQEINTKFTELINSLTSSLLSTQFNKEGTWLATVLLFYAVNVHHRL